MKRALTGSHEVEPVRNALLFAIAASYLGCAASAQQLAAFADTGRCLPRRDNSVICIYRNDSVFDTNAHRSVGIEVDGHPVGFLPGNGYMEIIFPPGQHRLTVDRDHPKVVESRSGPVQFFRVAEEAPYYGLYIETQNDEAIADIARDCPREHGSLVDLSPRESRTAVAHDPSPAAPVGSPPDTRPPNGAVVERRGWPDERCPEKVKEAQEWTQTALAAGWVSKGPVLSGQYVKFVYSFTSAMPKDQRAQGIAHLQDATYCMWSGVTILGPAGEVLRSTDAPY